MKRSNTLLITLLTLLTSVFVFTSTINAQLVGTKTIPGDYATIQLAVADLNTLGVGAGGVTFNIIAGYTESITSPIFVTATGTVTDPIVFQKSGAGANPLVSRTDAGTFATSALGGQGDAVILIQGSDYVTFDGIDVSSSDQGIEYGYYLRKGSVTNGCKFVTIKNAVVTLTKGTSAYVVGIYSSNNDSLSLVSSATGITVTSVEGRNENVTLTGNTIQNVFAGIVLRGYGHSVAPYDFYDQNYVVGSVGAGNIIQNFGGNAVASAYGVYLIYHNNASVSYNTINNISGGGSGATSTFYGVFHSTGATSTFSATYNNIDVTSSAAASGIYGINNAATGNLTLENNNITINLTAANSSTVGYLYNSSAAASLNVSIANNIFNGTTLLSTGSIYLIYNNSSQLAPGVTNISGNSISGSLTRTGASGTIYCYYNNGSPTSTENVFNNVFDSLNNAGSTGALYGILSTTGSSHTHNIYNNTISDFVGGTGITYGIHRTLASGSVHDNSVYNLSGGSSVYGISLGSGNQNVYNNDVYNLNSSSILTTAGLVTGVVVSGVTNHNIYNNFISNLKAPLSASLDALRGIGITATNTASNLGLYYNTIYLSGTSAGANFGTSGIYHTNSVTNTTVQLDMRDNIVVNNCAPVGTGLTVAFRRSAENAALSNYSTLSNNNDFYAGAPGAANLIFYDGINSDQTIADFKTRVAPRESASFSENPVFVNSVTVPYDLRINTTTPTQLESGGIPVTTPIAITTDFDGDLRNASTPDVGADEFTGNGLDLSAPTIAYTNLQNTSSTGSRTLVATVTDASGVPTTAPGWPTLYWNINSAVSFTAIPPTGVSGSDYSYDFGTGVVAGDTVHYYIVAQDNATVPNVGAYPSAGASGFTTNPPAASTPPSNPSSYLITQSGLAGDYTVGLALFNKIANKNISLVKQVEYVNVEVPVEQNKSREENQTENTTLTPNANGLTRTVQVEKVSWVPYNNGILYTGDLYVKKNENPQLSFPEGIDGIYATITSAVADLNLRGVSGATRFLLVDTLYSTETLPIVVNVTNVSVPTSVNNVTIQPNTGIAATITGASAGSQVFKILNSYVSIDGSNSGGTTRDLTITNTSTTSPQVVVIGSTGTNPITNVTVKNTNIINGVNSSSALVISDGTNPGTAGYFSDITIQNNTIQKAYIGAYCNAVVASGNGSGLVLSQNDLSSAGANAIRYTGLYLQGVDSALVSQNTIANLDGTNGEDDRGIWLATGSKNTSVEKNNIHTLKYLGTGGYGAHGIAVSTASLNANVNVVNNLLSDISGDGYAYTGSFFADNPFGIYLFGTQSGVNAYYNSINLEGNTLNKTNALSVGISIGTGTVADLKNNIINNNLGLSAATGFGSAGIFLQTATTQLNYSNYNDIYVNPTGSGVKNIGQVVAAGYIDLASWQTASGKDSNSISVAPQFNTLTDLQPLWTSPVLAAGNPIAGITTDYVGTTRSATNPSIGAYETGIVLPMNGTYTVGLAAFNQAYGKNVYFEKVAQTVTKDLDAVDSYLDRGAFDYSEKYEDVRLPKPERFIEVVEERIVLMENGKPFDQNFFRGEQTLGIYPTLTSAVADLTLRGVDGPVTFELVDALYPNETYPILIPSVSGASSVNTITIKPAAGVTAEIPGSVTQASSTLQIGGGSYVQIDGSNNGTSSQDLTISAQTTSAPAIHFFNSGNNNVIKNVIVQSKNTSTGSGSLIFGSGTGSMNNLVENCTFKRVDTSATRYGIGVYFFSTTLSSNNNISKNLIVDFADRGITLQGGVGVTGNNLIGNEIYQINSSVKTSIYGIYLGRTPDCLVEANYIHDLLSTGTTPTKYGIYLIGASSDSMIVSIVNNVISLDADSTQPAGIRRGLDYFGYAANSVKYLFNTVFINGTDVTGTSQTAGIIKRDAAYSFSALNNTIYNSRSNGTGTGKHYAVAATNTVFGTTANVNNNNYFVSGTGGVLGLWGTADQVDLTAWQTVSGVDVNSISANPQYVSLTDLRPQLTSPLLGAGVNVPAVTVDFLGVTRGNPPTIGAFEQGVATALAGPTNLSAIADTFAVVLNWNDNSVAELGFYIERKNGDTLSVDPYVVIDTVGVDVVTYFDGGRTPNTTYTYRVQAYNSLGVSAYSNEVTTTTIVPVELTTFVANVSDQQISLNWETATELNNSGFEVERNLNGEWKKISFIQGKGTTTEKQNYSYVDQFKYQSYQGTIQYRLKQIDFDGTYAYSNTISVEIDFTPKEYTLYQNYPNPFNPSTTIKFALPFDSKVRIVVYNLLGEQVDVIFDQVKEVGYHNVNFNASSLASGVYIYTIDAKSSDGLKNFSSVKKMMLIK